MDKNSVIAMYEATEDVESIMEHFCCDEKTVRKILKDAQADRTYNTFSAELYGRIRKLYLDGLRQKEISDILQIGIPCIVKTLKKEGIALRSVSDNNKRYSRNSHYFDDINTANKAYILGLLFADGNNHTKHNAITITLQKQDAYILEEIKKEICYSGPLREVRKSELNPRHKDAVTLCINDEWMSQMLRSHGLVDAKSLIAKFPPCVPRKFRWDFARGYFDGDGCVYEDHKHKKITTCVVGTHEMMSSFSALLKELECKHNITHPKQSGKSNTYVLRTSANRSSYIFLRAMYDNAELKLSRKHSGYEKLKVHYLNHPIL